MTRRLTLSLICLFTFLLVGQGWGATYTIGPGQTYTTFTALVATETLTSDDIVDGGGNTFAETWTLDGSGASGQVITLRNATIDGSTALSSWTEEEVSGGGTLTDQQATTSTALSIFNAAGRKYASTMFTAGATYYIGKVEVHLTKVLSPTMTITAYIYSDSSGSPGSVLATSTTTLDASTVAGTFHEFTFDGTLQLASGTVYHIILGASAVSATNYVTWGSQGFGGDCNQSADGSSWSDITTWFPSLKTYTPVTAAMTVYYATDAVAPNMAYENGTAMLKKQTKAELVANSWWFDDPNNRVYVRTSGDNDPAGYTIIVGARDYGINTAGFDYITITNMTIQHTNKYGVIIWPGSTNVTVQDSTLNKNGYGVHVLGTASLITRNTISNGHIITDDATPGDDYGAVGVNVENSNCEISYNTFSNLYAPSTDFGEDGGCMEIYQYDNATIDTVSFHHNSCTNTSGWVEIGGGTTGTVQNVAFYSNIIKESRGAPDSIIAIHNGGGAAPITINNLTFYNNTIVSTGTGTGNEVMWTAAAPGSADLLFKNNIVYVSNITAMATHEPTEHTNNIYRNTADTAWSALGFVIGATESKADPLLVSTSDLHLQSTSPAINAGVNVGLTYDFDNKPLPVNGAYDMGAYEYGVNIAPAHWGLIWHGKRGPTFDGAGPVLHLPFYKYGAEQSKIWDISGNENHGVITGATPAVYPMLSGVELVTNGGFDSDTAGWSATNGTLSSVAGGQSGNCLEITRTDGAAQYAYRNYTGLVVGRRYAFSGWMKSGTSNDELGGFGIAQTDIVGDLSSIFTTSSGGWRYHYFEWVADRANVSFACFKASATPGTMLFDSISVQEVTGYEGLGWNFDGVDDVVVHPSLNLGTTHTLHYWVKHNGTSGVVHGGAANYHGLLIDDAAGTAGYNAGATAVTVAQTSNRQPTLFSISRSGTSVSFYQNGSQVGVTQTLDANNALVVTDVGRYSTPGSYYKGVVYSAVARTVAETASEVKNYFEGTRRIVGR